MRYLCKENEEIYSYIIVCGFASAIMQENG